MATEDNDESEKYPASVKKAIVEMSNNLDDFPEKDTPPHKNSQLPLYSSHDTIPEVVRVFFADEACENCDGEGQNIKKIYVKPGYERRYRPCHSCFGVGYQLTPEGEELLELLITLLDGATEWGSSRTSYFW